MTVPAPLLMQPDEVLTGEAVALDVQPVGVFMRTLGALIDVVVSFLLLLVCVLLLTGLLTSGVLDESTMQITVIVMIVVILIALPTAVETLTKGRSLGKLAVGGRIVRLDGGAAGFRHAFIRALIGFFEIYMMFGAIALLVGIFTPRSQRLGDLVAGTYAERTRTPALPAPAPGVPYGLLEWAAIADVARLPDRLGRRIAAFAARADRMQPGARARIAAELAGEVRPHVAPIPPVDPETLLRGVVGVRRDRELRALSLQAERVARLTPSRY